jgi:hypothetical protein
MPPSAEQILCATVLTLVECFHFIRFQQGPETVGVMVYVTITAVILANNAVMGCYCTGFSEELEQVRIPHPAHRVLFIPDPDIPAAWQETSENFLPVQGMTSKNGEWISMTSLGQPRDVCRLDFRFT